jgi:hypothetical protein
LAEYNREQGQTTTPSGSQPGYQEGERWGQEPSPRESVTEEYREGTEAAQKAAREGGRKASEYLHQVRMQTAESMERAAGTMRERASKTEGMPADAGTMVADRLEGAAGYLREHDHKAIANDVQEQVRQHSAQALAGAVFAGFLLGRMLRAPQPVSMEKASAVLQDRLRSTYAEARAIRLELADIGAGLRDLVELEFGLAKEEASAILGHNGADAEEEPED